MNTTQIFSENQLRAQLKKYLQDEITKCDEKIGECKFILIHSDSKDITVDDRVRAHKKLEVIQFRRFWLYEQMDAIYGNELNEYINRK